MAYLDLADMLANAARAPVPTTMPRRDASEPSHPCLAAIAARATDAVAVPAPAPTLSTLEWQVVTIARRDRLSSLKAPGLLARATALIFGVRGTNPRLANPRLEALRRIAVAAWHKSYRVPADEIRRFLAAGYSTDQLEMLLDHIGRGRAALNQGKNHEHARAR